MSTRREFLIKLSAGAAILAGVDNLPIVAPTRVPDIIIPSAQSKVEVVNPTNLLNEILAAPLFTPERTRLELRYLGEVVVKDPTLTNIDRGFMAVSDPSLRAKLLEQRWTLRKEGKEGLEPVPDDKIIWARANGVHPEILALCLDTYEETKKDIIRPLNKAGKLRDDGIIFKEDNLDEPLINPGGMARLIHYETGDVHHFSPYAFTNVGDGLAVEQLNPLVFPTGISDLEELCGIVNRKTGFKFNPNNIPGSLWQNRDNPEESGGAIPPIQLMPPSALKYYKLIKEVTGIELNPFDLRDAIKIAWVFIAHHEKIFPRIGYRRGILKDQQNALFKWNKDKRILELVLVPAFDYSDVFIASGKYKH